MGEYYKWVNVDRREFLSPPEFGYGSKRWETMWREKNELLRALRELLSGEWSGCRVAFLGDEKTVGPDSGNETLQTLYRHTVSYGCPGDAADLVEETYRNVDGLFRAAQEEVRWEIGIWLEELADGNPHRFRNEYGIDPADPYRGLFERGGRDFRYTLNYTKKLCFAFPETTVLDRKGRVLEYTDPLPDLMAYGRAGKTGAWLGDLIGVADAMPQGYTLLREIMIDW